METVYRGGMEGDQLMVVPVVKEVNIRNRKNSAAYEQRLAHTNWGKDIGYSEGSGEHINIIRIFF